MFNIASQILIYLQPLPLIKIGNTRDPKAGDDDKLIEKVELRAPILSAITDLKSKAMRAGQNRDLDKFKHMSRARGKSVDEISGMQDCIRYGVIKAPGKAILGVKPVIPEAIDPFDSDQDVEIGFDDQVHFLDSDDMNEMHEDAGLAKKYGKVVQKVHEFSSDDSFRPKSLSSDENVLVNEEVQAEAEMCTQMQQTEEKTDKIMITTEVQTNKLPLFEQKYHKKTYFPHKQPEIPTEKDSEDDVKEPVEEKPKEKPVKKPMDPMLRLQILRGDFIFDNNRLPDYVGQNMSSNSTCTESSESEEEHFLPFFPHEYLKVQEQNQAKEIIQKAIEKSKSNLKKNFPEEMPQKTAQIESKNNAELHQEASTVRSKICRRLPQFGHF